MTRRHQGGEGGEGSRQREQQIASGHSGLMDKEKGGGAGVGASRGDEVPGKAGSGFVTWPALGGVSKCDNTPGTSSRAEM
jgi:hypothetical protein